MMSYDGGVVLTFCRLSHTRLAGVDAGILALMAEQ